ncbi:MAG TPA: coenzyme F420-0:L-glutamate ligase [Dehalococcoidia bacterium]|nr:coenzyme F420-0:L-glutamate ligase [Dehalococcoidia bacterium]
MAVTIQGIDGLPEIKPGDDLGRMIAEGCARQGVTLQDGDVFVVTQKAVSKSEDRYVNLEDVEPSPLATQLATQWDKDARHVEVVLRESKRIVKMDRGVIICETRHGLVCANAGVDASNVPDGLLMLLPADPDASAQRIRATLRDVTGADVAVIISDTFGRPWRAGYTEVAIGVAGMLPLVDYVGQVDTHGRELKVTVICIADELASAAEMVTGKINRVPVAHIRGYAVPRGEGSAKEIVRAAELDLFR